MKALSIKIEAKYAEGFVVMVDHMLNSLKFEEDEDKMMIAGLLEVKHRLNVKLLKPKKQYTLTLTPVQALSIRLLYTGYVNEVTTSLGNYLHTISLHVKKLYS